MDYSKITLQQLSDAIERNKAIARTLQARILWGFEKGKRNVYGRVYYQDKIGYTKLYPVEGRHLHFIIAEMQDDFLKHLEDTIAWRKKITAKPDNRDEERQEMFKNRWQRGHKL